MQKAMNKDSYDIKWQDDRKLTEIYSAYDIALI